MIEDFIAFMDAIFYEGYAERLAAENPEHFKIELNQYLENYGSN